MNEKAKDQSSRAFEYVCGSMSSREREEYQALLASSDPSKESSVNEENALVNFWQERLLTLDNSGSELQPKHQTWENILARISSKPGKNKFTWHIKLAWVSSLAASLALLFLLVKPLFLPNEFRPNTDYIAVLTSEDGAAVLTALTTAKSNKMWLQWELQKDSPIEGEDKVLQLWAQSKRDGQIRSLAIFEDPTTRQISLDEASFRLVSDSAWLLLTLEEPGGSAIDEPSEEQLAKGICIRFIDKEA